MIEERLMPVLCVREILTQGGLTLFPLAAEPIWRRLFVAGDIDHALLQSHTIALLERGLESGHAP